MAKKEIQKRLEEAQETYTDIEHISVTAEGIKREALDVTVSAFPTDKEAPKGIQVRAGKAISLLGQANDKKSVRAVQSMRQDLYGNKELQQIIESGQLRIAFEGEKAIRMDGRTYKTFTWLNHLAALSHYQYDPNRTLTVNTSLEEMMELWNLKSKRKARQRFRDEVDQLKRVSITLEDKESYSFAWVPLAGGTCGINRKGEIVFTFSAEFMANVLSSKAPLMELDPAIFRTDDQYHKHAFSIAMRLYEHSNMNMGKPNETRLKVSNLIKDIPSLPKPSEIKARQETLLIIKPLERDLNHLADIGVLEWDYCHSKDEPLTDEEQAQRLDENGEDKPLPYKIAKNLYITWAFSYSNKAFREKKLANKEAHRLRALEAKERKRKRIERREREADKRIGEAMANKVLEEDAEE